MIELQRLRPEESERQLQRAQRELSRSRLAHVVFDIALPTVFGAASLFYVAFAVRVAASLF